MLKTYVCTRCGAEFQRTTRQGTGKIPYCSRECYQKSLPGRDLSARGRRITKICPVCKNEFEAGGQYRKRGLVCCSRECAGHLKPHLQYQECKIISPTDAAYIAGFLDGEGCIALVGRRSGGNSLRVGFSQCEKGIAVFTWMKEVTGIQSNIIYKKRASEKHDIGLTLACHGNVAEGLLRQVLPYLIVKKQQAELALDFQDKTKIPEWRANLEWQKECLAKMHELNKRGNQA